jgi:hypothetical protein
MQNFTRFFASRARGACYAASCSAIRPCISKDSELRGCLARLTRNQISAEHPIIHQKAGTRHVVVQRGKEIRCLSWWRPQSGRLRSQLYEEPPPSGRQGKRSRLHLNTPATERGTLNPGLYMGSGEYSAVEACMYDKLMSVQGCDMHARG